MSGQERGPEREPESEAGWGARPHRPEGVPEGVAGDLERAGDPQVSDRVQLLAQLLAAREGTGVGFPAAVRTHLRVRGDAALGDALDWGAASSAIVRLVGLEVLAGLVRAPIGGSWASGEEPAAAALELAGRAAAADPDPELRWAAAKALGLAGAATIDVLAALVRDDDPDVRWQAVSSLPIAAGSPPAAIVVAALAAATTDADDDVADHAVFALGLQLDVDTPAVRDALAVHLGDGDRGRPDTAAQAALALAQRGDPRAAPAVREALAAALAGTQDDLDELEEDWTAAAAELPASPGVADLLAQLTARRSAQP